MKLTPVTLCFPLRDAETGTEVLLGLKRTGFGIGKIVGIGGHVEPGESDAEAVVREVWEEAGIVVLPGGLAHAGVVEFIFPARPEWNMSCRLFTTRRWEGEARREPGDHARVVRRRVVAAGPDVAGCGALAAPGAGRRNDRRRRGPQRGQRDRCLGPVSLHAEVSRASAHSRAADFRDSKSCCRECRGLAGSLGFEHCAAAIHALPSHTRERHTGQFGGRAWTQTITTFRAGILGTTGRPRTPGHAGAGRGRPPSLPSPSRPSPVVLPWPETWGPLTGPPRPPRRPQ